MNWRRWGLAYSWLLVWLVGIVVVAIGTVQVRFNDFPNDGLEVLGLLALGFPWSLLVLGFVPPGNDFVYMVGLIISALMNWGLVAGLTLRWIRNQVQDVGDQVTTVS